MRRRLFALLVAPLVVMIVIGAQLTSRVSADRESAESAALVVEIATRVANLDGALGNETLVAVTTSQQSRNVGPRSLEVAEGQTDEAIRALESILDRSASVDHELFLALDGIDTALLGRPDLTQGWISPLQLVDRYGIVRKDLVDAMVGRATAETEVRYANDVLGFISLVEARSAHLDERVTLDLVLRYQAWSQGQHGATVIAIASQQSLIDRASALSGSPAPKEISVLREAREVVLTTEGDIPPITRGSWRALSDDWLSQLNRGVDDTAASIARRANTDAASAAAAQRYTLAGVILATLFAVLTAGLFGLGLVRRVRRIANAAGELSLEDAPVASLNDGGRDEIAEMADAFDRMSERIRHGVAVREVESEVRASILSERPLEQTLAACARLLPEQHAFEVEDTEIYLVSPDNQRTLLSELDATDLSEDNQLAISLAKVAQLRSASLRALRHQATFDALTGLLNRAAALQRLEELCQVGRPAVVYLDLDHFKRLNDAHGHENGDRALVSVARVLEDVGSRTKSVAGRIGGDEFLMIVTEEVEDEELRQIGETIVERVNALRGIASSGLSASIGIAPNHTGQSAEELVHEADAAMYRAKHEGRSCVVLADDSIRSEIEAFDDIERGLATALALDEFTVAYQGIWDAQGRTLVSLEALARWTDANGRSHSPAAFFAAAERIGCAHEIDRLILRKVSWQIRDWADSGLAVPTVHVNMSAQTLSQPDVVSNVLATLRNAGCPPAAIVAEITESALISEIETAGTRLDQLRAAGVRIAVDDFGEGYSSLRYVSKLPIDILKIDRQFIDHIDSNQNNRAIVRAVVSLASTLGMTVVAEGVERIEEQRLLFDIGCSHVQGYLLGRPEGPDDAAERIRASQVTSEAGRSERLSKSQG